jgi:hypothetical protein
MKKNRTQGARKKSFISSVIFALIIFCNVVGQTAAALVLEDGVIGNLYLKGFEETCAKPITQYLDCLSTKNVTGSSCYNENLAVLTCTGNCPSDFASSWLCLIGGGSCTISIFQWLQCARKFCSDTYLLPYGQCVAEQKTTSECSSCPILATVSSSALLTLPPTCSVFEQDYCAWQSCCEPCQYYLNFYGKCMQVNFNSCQDFFLSNPDLPTCPLQIQNAAPPADISGGDDGTTTDTGNNPTSNFIHGPRSWSLPSKMTFGSLMLLFLVFN